MRPIGCAETSGKNCHCTLLNFPEECRLRITRWVSVQITDRLASRVVIGANEAVWPVPAGLTTNELQCSCPNVNQERSLKADISRTQILTSVCLSLLSVSLCLSVLFNSFVCISPLLLPSCVHFVFISFVSLFLSTFWFVLSLGLFLILSFIYFFLPCFLCLLFSHLLALLVAFLIYVFVYAFLSSCLSFCFRF